MSAAATLTRASARQWLIAYDVADARRRRRLAALLEGCAVRAQLSVFRTEAAQAEIVGLLQRGAAHVRDGDRLRAWPVRPVPGLPASKRRAGTLPGYWIV